MATIDVTVVITGVPDETVFKKMIAECLSGAKEQFGSEVPEVGSRIELDFELLMLGAPQYFTNIMASALTAYVSQEVLKKLNPEFVSRMMRH